jgi:DNA-directed RNA polymerase specialized sigma24 family protein
MDDASDGELLELARQGHSDAFSTLVRRHDRYLYRVARSVLRDDNEQKTSYSRLIFRLTSISSIFVVKQTYEHG